MPADSVVAGYAGAIFEIARADGVLEQVEDELFRFARTVEQEPKLREALHDVNLPPEHRANLVRELLGKKVSATTLTALAMIVGAGRARDLSAIVDAFVARAAAERAKAVAEVRSAVPLGEEQRAALKRAIAHATGKEVEIKVIVDQSVIGGLLVRVGDQVIDGTVRRRLSMAREKLERK